MFEQLRVWSLASFPLSTFFFEFSTAPMGLDQRGDIAVAEIVLYAPILVLSVILAASPNAADQQIQGHSKLGARHLVALLLEAPAAGGMISIVWRILCHFSMT